TAAGEVVGAQLYNHAVFRNDADVVLPHLARDRCEDLMPVAELNAEHRVGQRFGYDALDLDDTVFLSHSLADTSADWSICGGWDDCGPRWTDTPKLGARHQRSILSDAGASGNLSLRSLSRGGLRSSRRRPPAGRCARR